MRTLGFLRLTIASALLAFFAALPAAGAQLTPSWAMDFGAPVTWQRVTSLGDLIVSTSKGLYGLDPQTGVTLWSHADLANLSDEGFEEIPGAPLFVIDAGDSNRRIVILNATTGTQVFDSQAAGLVEIQGKYVMPRSGGLLIVGFEQGNFNTQLFMIDMATGKQRWHSEVLSKGKSGMVNLLLAVAQVAMDVSPVHADPIELDDGSFLLAAMGAVHRLGGATGSELWKTDAGNARVLHLTDKRPGVLFVGSEEGDDMTPYHAIYQALSLDTGEPVWSKRQRFRGALSPQIISAENGLIVSERTEGTGRVRLLDYDSGKSLWGKKGKGTKVKGGIIDHDFSNAGVVITTGYDSAWNDKGTEYLLYVLDSRSGEPRFKKPVKVKGRMRQTELLQNGLLYVTTHEMNVFRPATGELLHGPNVRSKKPIVTRWHGDSLYAFNTSDGQIYRLGRGGAELAQVSKTKAELRGKDQPMELDVRQDAIILTGHQNVIGYSSNGDIRFSAYHEAPRHHGLIQALLWAQALRAAMASADAAVAGASFYSASNETETGSWQHAVTTELGKGYTELSEGYMGLAGDYAHEARRRFQASAAARDFVFMMIKKDKRIALAQVSKHDGRIVALVDLGKDKKPSYQVDDIGDRIFYRQKPSEIVAYDFAPAAQVSQVR
ncbi:MAG: PQQ-binding-like beta-propeller repeat protein [Gammaproteobacteria bacterium]|nr:PQQ-binding-like beta-propeller repeat protein [Gammaproteobacteria bacterium]